MMNLSILLFAITHTTLHAQNRRAFVVAKMTSRKLFACMFALMFALFAVASALIAVPTLAAEKINSIVAVVNYQSISRLELKQREQEVRRQAQAENIKLSDEEVQRKALDAQIFRLLQLQEAKRLRLQIPEEALDERVEALRLRWGANSASEMRALVKERLGLNMEDFRQQVREEMELDGVFYREVYSKIEVFDEEIEHFLQTETNFAQKREYQLRHFLLKVNEDEDARKVGKRKAESVRRQARQGVAFAKLIRDNSNDEETIKQEGLLPWYSAEQLPNEFVTEAQNLKEGEFSKVIETGRGFHLLQLVGARGGQSGEGNLDRLRISHLFLPKEQKEKARELLLEIENGADFEALVTKHSIDDKSRDTGGDLGWFLPDKLPDYFVDVPLLREGEVSEPIESPFGFHLVKMTEREKVTMGQAREWARNTLRERRALAQRLDWVQQLRGRAYIIITDPEYAGALEEIAG